MEFGITLKPDHTIDRMVALMYGLDDIRLLFENDVRFLEQFD